jgi:hypothetical protein
VWLLPLLFVALWIGITAFLSWWGGWATLARAYPMTTECEGPRWRFRTVLVRHANPLRGAIYRSSVTLRVNARGLCLAVGPLFRVGHPPLFIPWADVRIETREQMFGSYLEFRLRRAEGVWLRLARSLGAEVAAAGGLAVPT